ncbi:hypothetical protein [Granulicella mallensis]|uniref:Uncharacterized protein n=1 Tax=Granulicella mallensis TaxID=940614 RepID=A0A7W7ZQT0_9BACT|nr:hypothetical protein [Granulicella mallensis]MBB5063581.1 hypothetical protein [Granulicella mallensis]
MSLLFPGTYIVSKVRADGQADQPPPRKAIQSLRLRLHSGLRQSGTSVTFDVLWHG